VEQDFEIIGSIYAIEVIASGSEIRDLPRLIKFYGKARWRKLKGIATVRLLRSGHVRLADLHWYEAHGIGKREMKIAHHLD
jgi:hypothetical protein